MTPVYHRSLSLHITERVLLSRFSATLLRVGLQCGAGFSFWPYIRESNLPPGESACAHRNHPELPGT